VFVPAAQQLASLIAAAEKSREPEMATEHTQKQEGHRAFAS
jgi:hypothetical protein